MAVSNEVLKMSNLQNMFKTAKSSLIATVVAFQLGCALPGWVFFTYRLHEEGNLSFRFGVYVAALCVVACAVAGFLFLLTVVEPIRKDRYPKA